MVSVVIPIYNMACYIGEVLECVLAQTYQNFEIICVENGSTDETPRILAEYAQRDARIRVLSIGPSNAGAARNAGYAVSKGEYLLFLDADDVFSPTLIENLLAGLEGTSAEVAVCQYRPFKEGEVYPKLEQGMVRGVVHAHPAQTMNLFNHWVGWAWDKLFTRAFIEQYQLKFQEIASSNDLAFTYGALSLASHIYEVKAPLIAHRYHAGSIETKRYKTPMCCVEALKAYAALMEQWGRFAACPRLKRNFKRYVARFFFWNLYTITNEQAYVELKRAMPMVAKLFEVEWTWVWWKFRLLCFGGRLCRRMKRFK